LPAPQSVRKGQNENAEMLKFQRSFILARS